MNPRLHPLVRLSLPWLAAGGWLLAPAGLAQITTPLAKEETVELSVFQVTASRDVGYQSTNAAEVTRMNTPIEDIPMNVTVFNQQFIEDLLATDTSELLAYEASAVKTTENDGFLARGSASVGTNFLNGFAQTSGFGSQPLANIERVEVIRGPAAVLYGAGGYGGTVNRITKQPRESRHSSARIILGDASSYRLELDHGGPLSDVAKDAKFFYRVNGIWEDGETWFGQTKKEKGIAPSLAWKIGPRTKLILEYFYDWRENQASWETPVHAGDPRGLVTGDGTYRVMPRQIAWIYPDDYRRNTRQVASYDLRHAFSRNLQFRSQFQWESKEQDQREVQALSDGLTILADTALMPIRWRDLPRDTENYRTRNELVWEPEVLGTKHRILAGHSWDEQYDLNIQYLSSRNNGGISNAALLNGDGLLRDNQAGPLFNSYPTLTYAQFLADPRLAGFNPNLLLPINLFDRGAEAPLPDVAARPPLHLNTHTKTYTASQSAYFNDVFSLARDRVFVMAGMRYTDSTRRTLNRASGTLPTKVLLDSAPTVEVNDHATTGSVGLVWHLNAAKNYTLYGNLNNSFSPEFRSNPDGSSLDAERGEQKEIGLRFNLRSGRLTGLVTYYDLLQDNVTRADPNNAGYFIQEKGQRSTGFELSLNARLTDNWLVFGGYANTDARNELTGVVKDLQPRHRFTMFNRYNFTSGRLKGLGLSLGTIYVGERPLTPTTSRNEPDWGPMPDYWKVDAIVSYKLRRPKAKASYDFSFKVNNVFDNEEIYYVGQWYRYTLDPGRQWQAVVTARF